MNRFIRVGNAHYEEVVRVTHTIEETYGQVLLSQLFTHIWFGNWDEYEETVNQLPADLLKEFPFHQYYERKETEQWHDNYFAIPGIYFVPPYLSSYQGKSEKEEVQAKQDLLCLIGTFDKLGFYYPLEQEELPDHFGSLTAFITAAASEEVKALEKGDRELAGQLRESQHEMYHTYLEPGIEKLWERNKGKLTDPFFKEFIPYYMACMGEIVGHCTKK